MKEITLVVKIGITIFFLTCSHAFAQSVLGELCWKVDEGGEDYSLFKLAVVDIGNGHLSFNGIEVFEEGNPNPDGEIVQGTGEIVDGRVVIMLNTTYNDSEATGSATFYINLSFSTLDGTYHVIGTTYDKLSSQITTGYATGAYTSQACP